MHMNIDFDIILHSYWHCGSGLAAGADVDSLVVKDRNGMPYIPGKTVKGLLRDVTEEYLSLTSQVDCCKDAFGDLFGYAADDSKDIEMRRSPSFFSNAALCDAEYNSIVYGKYSEHMYKSVSSTAIGKDGIAEKHSLRKTEVVVPCTLHGTITDVPDTMCDILIKAAGMIKQLGTSRSRGLGRCTITLIKKEV